MEGCYGVKLGKDTVGKLEIQKAGLYYHFLCRCKMKDSAVYRLNIQCADDQIRIGVPVPDGTGYLLERKLPVKLFSGPVKDVYLSPMHETVEGRFVPLSPEEPFGYIADLEKGFLSHRDGKIGVFIP